jgi:hypothetical protein
MSGAFPQRMAADGPLCRWRGCWRGNRAARRVERGWRQSRLATLRNDQLKQMSITPKQHSDFEAAVEALREIAKGKEATMYTALRSRRDYISKSG